MTSDFDQNNQNITGQGQEQSAGSAYSYNTNTGAEDAPTRSSLRFGPGSDAVTQNYQPPQPPSAAQTPPTDSTTYHYYYGAGSQQKPEGTAAYGTGYQPQNTVNYGAETPNEPGAAYRPADAYTPPVRPGYTAATASTKKKKKSNKGAIVAVALICLILGLGIGGGVMWFLNRDTASSVEDASIAEAETSNVVEQSVLEIGGETGETAETAEEENTAFNSTTIEITTNSETTAMTPQSVYEHYVNAVVAIANEGTSTNIFGQVSATASTGSGMIISEDGYILTNNHVVEGAEKLTVTMTSGEEYEATIIGTDSDNDVALIKIEGEGFPTVSIGDSDTIQVGEQLCAIGNPLGELTNTLTVGYVSALDREINEDGIPINMFQTDCAINSGNSGGPIFDMNGNVVGITTAKYSSSGSSYSASIEGIGFCIPINDAMDIVNDLLQYGYVRGRVSMGIMCQAISSTVTQYYNLPAGIYVSAVEEGSAAEAAGMVQGDIICAIDGVEVSSVTDLKVKLKEYAPGDTATLTVYRYETRATEEMDITFDEMVSTTTTQESMEEEVEEDSEDYNEVPIDPDTQQDGQSQQGQQINPFNPFG